MNNNDKYFGRAMSKWEYDMWMDEGVISSEWIDLEEEICESGMGQRGYGIRFLKEDWVDAQVPRRFGDIYALIVGVRAQMDEFILNDRVAPVRYKDREPISMERVKIIYDPRRVIVPEGVELDLGDPIKLLRD